MKFTKPINREVEIDGNTFIVSMDEAGIGFRHKGKRKTVQVNWANVLEIAGAEGEDTHGRGFQDAGSHSTQSTGQQHTETAEGVGGLTHTAAAGERSSEV